MSQDVYKFLLPLLWNVKWPLNIEKHQAILREKILPCVDPGKAMLGSWESLGSSPVDRFSRILKRLHSVVGPFRIMVTIRNPLTWIVSEYFSNMRGHFIRRNRPWMGKSAYIDFDDWFKRRISKRKSLNEIFTFSQNIQTAVDLLGKENVGVFVFENLKNNLDNNYSGICVFIGINVAKGLELTRHSHLHLRMTTGQIGYLQKLDQLTFWGKLLRISRPRPLLQTLEKGGQVIRSDLLRRNAGDGELAKIALSPHWEKGISDATRTGNRWIAENYKLPLDVFGYPL